MLSVKQGGIKYNFLSLWYDSTWDWTQVSQAIGELSKLQEGIFLILYLKKYTVFQEKNWKTIFNFLNLWILCQLCDVLVIETNVGATSVKFGGYVFNDRGFVLQCVILMQDKKRVMNQVYLTINP